jgi:hypothetical protein
MLRSSCAEVVMGASGTSVVFLSSRSASKEQRYPSYRQLSSRQEMKSQNLLLSDAVELRKLFS